jgi:K+-sensing histidine kinase KdpD
LAVIRVGAEVALTYPHSTDWPTVAHHILRETARARDEGGAGLGLAVSEAIVRRLGGTITVDTSPLGGARFTVRLPAMMGSWTE